MSHEKSKTTDVRTAVATLELVFLIPHLDKIAVTPANIAERIAATIHNILKINLRPLKKRNRNRSTDVCFALYLSPRIENL